MAEWCMAHPWMTFIICLFTAASLTGIKPFNCKCKCKERSYWPNKERSHD